MNRFSTLSRRGFLNLASAVGVSVCMPRLSFASTSDSDVATSIGKFETYLLDHLVKGMPQSGRGQLQDLVVRRGNYIEALLGGTDATALARAGVPIVVVTYGEGGCEVWTEDEPEILRIPADRIPLLADTVGAGDMFTALFAAALDADEPPRMAAVTATYGVAKILRLRL